MVAFGLFGWRSRFDFDNACHFCWRNPFFHVLRWYFPPAAFARSDEGFKPLPHAASFFPIGAPRRPDGRLSRGLSGRFRKSASTRGWYRGGGRESCRPATVLPTDASGLGHGVFGGHVFIRGARKRIGGDPPEGYGDPGDPGDKSGENPSLHELLEILGGSLEIHSSPNCGVEAIILAPMKMLTQSQSDEKHISGR